MTFLYQYNNITQHKEFTNLFPAIFLFNMEEVQYFIKNVSKTACKSAKRWYIKKHDDKRV